MITDWMINSDFFPCKDKSRVEGLITFRYGTGKSQSDFEICKA